MVIGTISICHMNAYVLINPRATHSFASNVFVLLVNRRLEPLIDALLVRTLVGNSVIIEHVYRDCELVVDNLVMLVDLLPMKLIEFEVILGMDFVIKYYNVL